MVKRKNSLRPKIVVVDIVADLATLPIKTLADLDNRYEAPVTRLVGGSR